MTPFPLDLAEIFGHWGAYVVYLFIGMAFGAVLEIAGFAYSPKLAGQFYFKDMTVLKVMFTGIIVAMVLIFLASGLGLLDFNLIWVNPTYLWPGIVGGLIMGAGFIIGGFCPGTSLVAAATFKVDGIFFALGAFFGIFLFGETVSAFEDFWYSSDMGRFTLMDLFNLDAGVIVLVIVVLALVAFVLAEKSEQIFGGQKAGQSPRWYGMAAGGLVILAAFALVVGQPSTQEKWSRISDDSEAKLAAREVQIDAGELLHLRYNNSIRVMMLDVRDETDYNLFHIEEARHVLVEDIPDMIPELLLEPTNTVFVVMSNDESRATEVWKTLTAESVPNVYILGGGVNGWLTIFGDEAITQNSLPQINDDQLGYLFPVALGSRVPAANPNPDVYEFLEYDEKVKLETRGGASGGGCG